MMILLLSPRVGRVLVEVDKAMVVTMEAFMDGAKVCTLSQVRTMLTPDPESTREWILLLLLFVTSKIRTAVINR